MSMQDTLIQNRTKLVQVLSGVDKATVLNAGLPDTERSLNAVALAAEIKRVTNKLLGIATSPRSSQVDYESVSRSEAYKKYRALVQTLQVLDLQQIDSPNQRYSFWINIYNSLTVDAVIQFGITRSVTEGWFGIISFFERAAYLIAGERFSLTDIEHGVLRANLGFPYFPGPHFSSRDPRRNWVMPEIDPRIHFALNCASRSCPPISFYHPNQVYPQLDQATQNFIDDTVSVHPERKDLSLSAIFRWYRGDFGGRDGVVDFILKYLSEGERKAWLSINRARCRVVYQTYDWGLNRI
jgi:hypothetical protein